MTWNSRRRNTRKGKVADARVEVRHNGVLIHPEFALYGRHARPPG